ncbi:1,4-alpha-glucan branching enzyme GlgB [Trichinella spiralis]|uniref:1,4-alpha-glucan branching enzyme GlgB n=1 Tax=Trichinella spiralis TaxID=6334 RepID=A0ABR3KAL6_TRISP
MLLSNWTCFAAVFKFSRYICRNLYSKKRDFMGSDSGVYGRWSYLVLLWVQDEDVMIKKCCFCKSAPSLSPSVCLSVNRLIMLIQNKFTHLAYIILIIDEE